MLPPKEVNKTFKRSKRQIHSPESFKHLLSLGSVFPYSILLKKVFCGNTGFNKAKQVSFPRLLWASTVPMYVVTLQKRSKVYHVIISQTLLLPDSVMYFFGRLGCGPEYKKVAAPSTLWCISGHDYRPLILIQAILPSYQWGRHSLLPLQLQVTEGGRVCSL